MIVVPLGKESHTVTTTPPDAAPVWNAQPTRTAFLKFLLRRAFPVFEADITVTPSGMQPNNLIDEQLWWDR